MAESDEATVLRTGMPETLEAAAQLLRNDGVTFEIRWQATGWYKEPSTMWEVVVPADRAPRSLEILSGLPSDSVEDLASLSVRPPVTGDAPPSALPGVFGALLAVVGILAYLGYF